MPRHRRALSTASSTLTTARDVVHQPTIPTPIGGSSSNNTNHTGQEMASMYDYLAKVILLGPSGSGKSCLLHRFVKSEWRVLSSQTIGVEFASKIVKVGDDVGALHDDGRRGARAGTAGGAVGGGGSRRKRIKLQLWDTAGTERFRSVSRSYYRGAAGAVLVYDVCDGAGFGELGTFLTDARALASSQLAVVLCGNKRDLVEPGMETLAEQQQHQQHQPSSSFVGSLLDDDGTGSLRGTLPISLGSQQRATTTATTAGRAVSSTAATSWAAQNRIPAAMEVSALSGENVDEVFHKLARTILTKIELGEIDPDDPMSGIQYGDADYYDDGGSSIKSGTGLTSDGYGSMRRKKRRGGGWGDVFRVGRRRSSAGNGGGGRGCC